MSQKSFYLTTTLPYVNSDPHVGFAMEIIRADIIARYKKLQGFEVFFNTGTDEHGQKIFDAAAKNGKSAQEYVDGYAAKFKELIPTLEISPDIHFVRTTDEHHVKAAQEFWKRCAAAGHIYKKHYKIKYCVGCELEKTESELVDGKCPLHPNLELEIREEENYFFKFSEFQKPLLDLYAKNPKLVVPDFRFNEIKAFVERGLEDFSISRLKSKMSWGVPVPDDEDHVMYVWFDALVNYISTLGWPHSAEAPRGTPENTEAFEKFWVNGTPTQYCGKDNLRQQSAMWQAMLMSAGIPNTHHIVIDGFITSGGQKMSKSLGNVISPFDVVNQFGAEALRYYVARELSPFEDSDMTMDSVKAAFNSALANGIGNLTSRILKMATSYEVSVSSDELKPHAKNLEADKEGYENFNIKVVADNIWASINELDQTIQREQPFKLVKVEPEKAKAIVKELLINLYDIAVRLEPIMPTTATTIQSLIRDNKMPEAPLFQRKD